MIHMVRIFLGWAQAGAKLPLFRPIPTLLF